MAQKCTHWRLPEFDINPSPVHWESVCRLKSSDYIDYKGLIMNERTPALFPEGCKDPGLFVFIGAMYVYSASGVSLPSPRHVYFEASDPEKPVMRVPKSQDDEDKVVTSFGWDKANFVFRDLYRFDPPEKHNFVMFTPANLSTYGVQVDEGVLTFAALPEGKTVVESFNNFQIKTGQKWEQITNTNETLGLYVDKTDGWKVKITANTSLWDKFCIKGFHPTHSTGQCERIPSDS